MFVQLEGLRVAVMTVASVVAVIAGSARFAWLWKQLRPRRVPINTPIHVPSSCSSPNQEETAERGSLLSKVGRGQGFGRFFRRQPRVFDAEEAK